jgi:hypothetical protein
MANLKVGKPFRVCDNPTGIRTEYLPNKSLERYRLVQLYGRQIHSECYPYVTLVQTSSAIEVSGFSGQSMNLSIIKEATRKHQRLQVAVCLSVADKLLGTVPSRADRKV